MSNDTTKQKSSSNKKLLGILQFIMPLLLIALGILLIRRRDILNNVFMTIGIFIALIGLICTVVYFATKQYEKKPSYLAYGIGMLLIGGIIIIIPFLADTFIPFCIGLFILVSGISGLMDALQLKKISTNWQIPLSFSVLITLMGIAVLICTFHLSGVVWIVIGVILIISGLMRLVNAIISTRTKKKHYTVIIEGDAKEVE